MGREFEKAKANSDFDQWLEAAQSGSDSSLGRCLDACRDYLLLVAKEQLPDDIKVKVAPSDLVQETYLEARRDFQDFDGKNQEQLLAWLRQILVNNAIDATRQFHNRQKRSVDREHPLPPHDSKHSGDGQLVDPEIRQVGSPLRPSARNPSPQPSKNCQMTIGASSNCEISNSKHLPTSARRWVARKTPPENFGRGPSKT